MDNLAEKLDQILNDPESMKQIFDTVRAIGIQPTGSDELQPTAELTGKITEVLQHTRDRDQKQEALIRALLPYLRPGKQRRLERAMQVAQLSHLAGFALRENPINAEVDDHV